MRRSWKGNLLNFLFIYIFVSSTVQIHRLLFLFPQQLTDLSVECKQFVLDYAVDYFKDDNLRRSLNTACAEEIKGLTCESGQKLILCVLEKKEKLSEYYCQHVVQRLEYLISYNFGLVSDFHKICATDTKTICNMELRENWQVIFMVNISWLFSVGK